MQPQSLHAMKSLHIANSKGHQALQVFLLYRISLHRGLTGDVQSFVNSRLEVVPFRFFLVCHTTTATDPECSCNLFSVSTCCPTSHHCCVSFTGFLYLPIGLPTDSKRRCYRASNRQAPTYRKALTKPRFHHAPFMA